MKTLKTSEDDWESPLGGDEEPFKTAEIFKDWESKAATPSLEVCKVSGLLQGIVHSAKSRLFL